jgi:FixJ family two-component response regulator
MGFIDGAAVGLGQSASREMGATPVVFVIDDDISTRDFLEPLIYAAGWQPETFASVQEFLSHPKAHGPHCLVLDVRIRAAKGLELQRTIAADRSDCPIIIVAEHGDVWTAVQAMKAGAVDILTKPFCSDVLLCAMRYAIERSRRAQHQEAKRWVLRERYASLSPRERQVLNLVMSGRLNKQVGGELGISEITVKAHRGRAMQKMKAKSLVDLMNMTATLGFVSTLNGRDWAKVEMTVGLSFAPAIR